VRPPGYLVVYSNYGAALAGLIVQEVSGMPWEDYIEKNILAPLDMHHTTVRQPVPAALTNDLVTGYLYAGGEFQPQGFEIELKSPAGAMSASATDMARFMIAHLQNGRYGEKRILSETTAKTMHSPLFTNAPGVSPMLYGFWERTPNGERMLEHGGGTFSGVTLLSLWQFQGQILWLHQFSVLANLRLRLWDTNTSTTIEWLPMQHFSYTDQLPGLLHPGDNWMGGIVAAPVTDPIQFVESFWTPQALPHLRNRRPAAREDFPGIARQAIANDRCWQAQAVRLRYAFERQDRPWEQDVCFTLAYAPVNAGVAMWNVQRAYTCFAPKGGLDARASHIKAVIANVNMTPEWLATYSVVKQLQRQGLQQQMADTAAFGRKLQEYTAHIRQLGQQMHEERMKSFDRIAESQREYLGGVETYNDPYQRQGVYMPAGYKAYWVNEKGEVVLSEQASYNPNVGDVNDWRKMERRDPMRQ